MNRQVTSQPGGAGDLLHRGAELGLIDAALAAGAADAYRTMRKLQHQLRLQGREARVDHAQIATQAAAVTRLWDAVFGGAAFMCKVGKYESQSFISAIIDPFQQVYWFIIEDCFHYQLIPRRFRKILFRIRIT